MWYLVLRDEAENKTLKVVEIKSRELALLTHQKFYAETRRHPKYLLTLHEAVDHEAFFATYPQYAGAQ